MQMALLKLPALAIVVVSGGGCSLLFPTEAGESLAHYAEVAPPEQSVAPGFNLQDIDGNQVNLADLLGNKRVVVQLGSDSCPVFRYRRFDMHELQRDYAGRVDFVVVYTQEAHLGRSTAGSGAFPYNPCLSLL